MIESSVEKNHLPRAAEFYRGKSVFVTGAAGFVGVVLLETLLRCCPGIKSIYILLRSKKNLQPEARTEQIFNKKIFEKLKEQSPELLKKVHVIPGDTSLPKLGMNEEDEKLLVNEVSVVFHCAAIISFTKALQFTLINNVLSLKRIIELCRQMRKFEALVYTSTAYSNCNIPNIAIKEEIYRLPFRAEKFLEAIKSDDIELLQELVAYCKPDWPNSYTFSKCLAENLILDTASDLPVAIIRPSIIICTWKNPIPGYLEGMSSITALSLGIGKGFIKVLYADPQCKLNVVPVDIVANSHVLAACSVATKRCTSPLVVNCTATEHLHITVRTHCKNWIRVMQEFPLPQSYEHPSDVIIIRNKFVYYMFAAYFHYLPGIVLDSILRISGKKPRLYSLYRFLDSIMDSGNFFLFRCFEFERKNLDLLDKLIHFEDRKDLPLDFSAANIPEMASSIPEASPFYDWKIDKKSKLERKRSMYRRHLLITCIQGMFLMTCFLTIGWVFSLTIC